MHRGAAALFDVEGLFLGVGSSPKPKKTNLQNKQSLFCHGKGVRYGRRGQSMARIWGGCHDRSPARSPAVLLLSRLRYRDCDRDRDPDHLMEVRSWGLGS